MPSEYNEKTYDESGKSDECILYTSYAKNLVGSKKHDLYVKLIVATLAIALGWRALVDMEGLVAQIVYFVFLATIFFCVLCSHYVKKHARILLIPQGISYKSPLPKLLQCLHPSWTLQWSDMISITLRFPSYTRNPEQTTLVFDTGRQKQSLKPLHWVCIYSKGTFSDRDMDGELCQNRIQNALIFQSPLIQYLVKVGIPLNLKSDGS